ncbi:mitochondrial 54S ribosomal protein uL24m MRPL40 NDAI_0K01120 [Naumovozyma dairenensis CBS 421]|uniref:KOW domain-containing protein n=1 Tax=Naumovozyma dairenensis (strain ATCC 10597 / BCRC 20456 / CBS 421 / NBRC 0211 / NRRL Y-12639) TaxID=1071378 RepID=G0WHP2_NAUDC|nr:hypothetical protein NDAI_0K01120 [Naumovozyma dairenensis CBS 421]CCD27303.1 hypothetical protein NDAI_0K01120 [Naumovozyma dairenensis CBS 421]
MSSKYAYEQLSKAGARVAERATKVPRHLQPRLQKIMERGTPQFRRGNLPHVRDEERFDSEKQWRFLVGDRVVITKGKLKGTVTTIRMHDRSTNGYILGPGGPTRKVPVPKTLWSEGQTTHIVEMPQIMKRKDLKLVADIEDPKTGNLKTVAVRDLVFRGGYYDENYKKVMPYRYVAGEQGLIVPWPKPEVVPDGELGTTPENVREQTFWADSYVRNPIPNAALLTIRNPNSKFRKGTLKLKDLARLVAPEMPLTPERKEYLRKEKELKAKNKNILERPALSLEDMQMIDNRIKDHLEKQSRTV